MATVILEDGGWNNSVPLTIHASLGQPVTITVIYQDAHGDDHPLYIEGPQDFMGPDSSANNPTVVIQFTPTAAGTYQVICLNPACFIHDIISGTLLIVVS